MIKYIIIISKATHSGWGYIPKIYLHPNGGSQFGEVIFEMKFLRWHFYICKQ